MYDGVQVFILVLDDLTDQRMTCERHGSPVSSGDERTPIPPGAQTNDFLSRVRTAPMWGGWNAEGAALRWILWLDLGGAGRQPRPLFRAIHQSAETGDTEAAGLNQNGNPLPYPLGRNNSWNGG